MFKKMSKKSETQTIETKARVLVTGIYGEANTVITLSDDALTAAVESGQVDTDPAAVAYAESK